MGTINSFTVIMYSSAAKVIFPSIEGSMVKKEKFAEAFASAYDVSAVTKLLFSLFASLEAVRNKLPPEPIQRGSNMGLAGCGMRLKIGAGRDVGYEKFKMRDAR